MPRARKTKTTRRPRNTGSLFKRISGGCWIGRWFDGSGRRREESTRTTDRAAAERILSARIATAALRKDGVTDHKHDSICRAGRKPLAVHLAEWQEHLEAKNNTQDYCDLTRNRVEQLLDDAGISATLGELSASAVQAELGQMQKDGLSLQTVQHYARAVKGFTLWLKQNNRLREDPLEHLSGDYDVATDRRYVRRALEADELARLIRSAEQGPKVRRMAGPDRAMAYRTAAGHRLQI